MRIPVHIISGLSAEPLCIVSAYRAWIVHDVKAQIERLEGTCRQAQRLLIQGRVLRDEETLEGILSQASQLPCTSADVKNDAEEDKGVAITIAMVRTDPAWAAVLRDVEDGWVELRSVAEKYRCDREIVIAAMRNSGKALEDAPEEFRSDRAVVLAAVSSNGSALRFAADELKRDPEVVLAAVRGSALALRCAAEELWLDRDFTLAVVQVHGSALMYASPALRRDRDVVLAAVRNDPSALRHAQPELCHDPDIKRVALASLPPAPGRTTGRRAVQRRNDYRTPVPRATARRIAAVS